MNNFSPTPLANVLTSCIVTLTAFLLFLGIIVACGESGKSKKRPPSGNISKAVPGMPVPISNITKEMPIDQRESICKNYSELLKATCMYDIDNIKGFLYYFSQGEIINKKNEYGWTPLMWACKNGQIDIVQLFLQVSTINVNLQDKMKRSALIYAVTENNREEIASILLNRPEINIDLADENQDTALRLAYQNRLLTIVKLLLNKKAQVNDHSLLVRAARDNQLEYLTLFLQFHASPNVADAEGSYPLTEAAWLGNLEIVRALINGRANLDVVERKFGSTPLILATKKGHYEVVALLLHQGARPNSREKVSNRTALWYASSLKFPEIVELIKSYGGEY